LRLLAVVMSVVSSRLMACSHGLSTER
jgi:hypothetical protein